MSKKDTAPFQETSLNKKSFIETTSVLKTFFTALNDIKQCDSIQQRINDLREGLNQKVCQTNSTSIGNVSSSIRKELSIAYDILETLEKLNGLWNKIYTDKENEIKNLHKV